MILLLLLSPLFAGASAGHVVLVERFECGPSGIDPVEWLAPRAINHCSAAVQDRANLCCKEHDLCYSLHSLTGNSQKYCVNRFCNCMQDVQDRMKDYECAPTLNGFCNAVRDLGRWSFERSVPDMHEGKLDRFVDQKPLGLDMQKLVDNCHFSKLVAEHCHDSVHTCLQSEHVYKHKRFSLNGDLLPIENLRNLFKYDTMKLSKKDNPAQDCHSTMYYCLQVIVQNDVDQNCTALARSMAMEANIYAKLDENTHGQSVIDNYLVIMGRMVEQCNQSKASIVNCANAFHKCAVNNSEEQPEHYGPARKIKIVCHLELSACVYEATKAETAERCIQARNVAKGIIREMELQPEASTWEKIKSYTSAGAQTVINIGKEVKDTVVDKSMKAVETVKNFGGAVADDLWENLPSWARWGR